MITTTSSGALRDSTLSPTCCNASLSPSPKLFSARSPALKKRMQGKTCFNFQDAPAPELITELKVLTEGGFQEWSQKKWL